MPATFSRATVPSGLTLIVLNDILEHLADPWECLALVRQMAHPRAHVVASIPNVRFWPILSDLVFQASWTYREAGVMDRTHLRFFTKESVLALFAESGLEVVGITGINKISRISLRWRALNLLFLGGLNDCLFPQFAVEAVPGSGPRQPR